MSECQFCSNPNPEILEITKELEDGSKLKVAHHFCKTPSLKVLPWSVLVAEFERTMTVNATVDDFKNWLRSQPKYAHLLRKRAP